MKYAIRVLSMSVLLAACHNNTEKKETPQEEGTPKPLTITIEPENATADMHYLWQAEFEEASGKLRMQKKIPLPIDSLNTTFILNHLNAEYPKIALMFKKISSDTIFVKINKSRYLTEQLGSTGADIYMTQVTYDLCELKGISYVNFDFKEGDHAAPGTYSKTDFLNVLK